MTSGTGIILFNPTNYNTVWDFLSHHKTGSGEEDFFVTLEDAFAVICQILISFDRKKLFEMKLYRLLKTDKDVPFRIIFPPLIFCSSPQMHWNFVRTLLGMLL